MGIENLLKCLNPILSKQHVKTYSGKKIGIDGYCWLHQSIFTNNMDLAFNKNSKSYLFWLKAKTKLLTKNGIIPIFVFDGARLPIKGKTDSEREYRRNKREEEANKLLEENKIMEAKLKKISSIDISPEMVYEFSKILKEMEIEFIVAPYEADAQLAYLDSINYIDIVCTEDSDLIAYGCKHVIYKLNSDGYCMEIKKENVFEPFKNKKIDFSSFDSDMFLQFCIFSGCDFFKLPGISTKKAHSMILKHHSFIESFTDLLKFYKNNLAPKVIVQFEKAYLTFKHQIVYCPVQKISKYLTEPQGNPDLSFLGTLQPPEIAQRIAKAEIHPIRLDEF